MKYHPNVEMPDIEKDIIDSIETTGLYFRPLLHCWQIWLVEEEGRKELVGYIKEPGGLESAQDLWDEFAYIVQNKVTSVYDLYDKKYIH